MCGREPPKSTHNPIVSHSLCHNLPGQATAICCPDWIKSPGPPAAALLAPTPHHSHSPPRSICLHTTQTSSTLPSLTLLQTPWPALCPRCPKFTVATGPWLLLFPLSGTSDVPQTSATLFRSCYNTTSLTVPSKCSTSSPPLEFLSFPLHPSVCYDMHFFPA